MMCESRKPSPKCGELNTSAAWGQRAMGGLCVLDEEKALHKGEKSPSNAMNELLADTGEIWQLRMLQKA